MAMMGVSGPATIPGDLVVNHAETLALAAAMQAHSPGAPTIYGSVLSNMDPRTGAIRLGSAEALMLCVFAHEMAKYVHLPSACGGIGSNAKTPGPQSALENSSMAIAGVFIGQEINNGIGMLDCSTVLSYEQMILDNEIVGRALACGRELQVNRDTLHLDMIKEVGILGLGKKKGSFLGERATMMEARQFYQSFFTSEPFEQWELMGKKDDLTLAKEKADWILKNHHPMRLDSGISSKLGDIVKRAAKE
jgi:trimethylamine--corrinoid protein Co-methyltransferase